MLELLVASGEVYGRTMLDDKLVVGRMLVELVDDELMAPDAVLLELVIACEGPYGPMGCCTETIGNEVVSTVVLVLLDSSPGCEYALGKPTEDVELTGIELDVEDNTMLLTLVTEDDELDGVATGLLGPIGVAAPENVGSVLAELELDIPMV